MSRDVEPSCRAIELLREIMADRDWEQKDVAEFVPCDRGFVSRAIAGVRRGKGSGPGISYDYSLRFQDRLGIPIESWAQPPLGRDENVVTEPKAAAVAIAREARTAAAADTDTGDESATERQEAS